MVELEHHHPSPAVGRYGTSVTTDKRVRRSGSNRNLKPGSWNNAADRTKRTGPSLQSSSYSQPMSSGKITRSARQTTPVFSPGSPRPSHLSTGAIHVMLSSFNHGTRWRCIAVRVPPCYTGRTRAPRAAWPSMTKKYRLAVSRRGRTALPRRCPHAAGAQLWVYPSQEEELRTKLETCGALSKRKERAPRLGVPLVE